MDGFETEKRAECKIHMGEGHNTVCMSLALNFKNNSDQQLFFFLAQLTADKHNTHWTTAFVHWGTERFLSWILFSQSIPHILPPGSRLLDEGHPLLVLTVSLVVLFLFARLTGLCAVVGHL